MVTVLIIRQNKYDKVGFRMQGKFKMPEIRVTALMWNMEDVK